VTRAILASMAVFGIGLGAQAGFAATVPYANDFSGLDGNTAFAVETPDVKWSVTGGVYRFATNSTSVEASATSLEIANAAGQPFVLQTKFTVTSAGTVNNVAQTLGFGLFGANAAFGGTNVSSAYYLADFEYANGTSGVSEGKLRILSLGDTAGFTAIQDGLADANVADEKLSVELNTTYILRLVGTYAGSTLNMSLALFDETGTTQIGTSAIASDTSPLTGTYFGYRNRHSIGGGTLSIDFDDYSLVPEPASLAVAGLGGLMLIRRRRA
jgi:hypothetical protein